MPLSNLTVTKPVCWGKVDITDAGVDFRKGPEADITRRPWQTSGYRPNSPL